MASPKRCSKCQKRARAEGQQWCAECSTQYARERRERRRQQPLTQDLVNVNAATVNVAPPAPPHRPAPALIPFQHKPGENGGTHRGPDRLPRAVKLVGRMALTALAMDDGKMMKVIVPLVGQHQAPPNRVLRVRLEDALELARVPRPISLIRFSTRLRPGE